MSLVFPGETVYARGGDNILTGATLSSTPSPSTSYTLATLLSMIPGARVRFGATGVAVTFALDAAAQGDIFVMPWWNLQDSGSPGLTVTLTNTSGLNVAISPAALQGNNIPKTTVVDLVAEEPTDATRTADEWTLTITGNLENVILGGAIAIFGPKRVLDPDLQWGFKYRKAAQGSRTVNDYGTLYAVDHKTELRSLVCSVRTTDLAGFESWFDANANGTAPGLLWPQITGLDAFLGVWPETFEAVNVEGTNYFDISWVFTELSKGKPV